MLIGEKLDIEYHPSWVGSIVGIACSRKEVREEVWNSHRLISFPLIDCTKFIVRTIENKVYKFPTISTCPIEDTDPSP